MSGAAAGTNGIVAEDAEAAALAEMLDRAIRSADAEARERSPRVDIRR
jgi:hypothetical protein